MTKKYLQLNDIGCYKRAYNLSNYVWDIVIVWEWFPKRTVGCQFVEAVDSIPANIAEGFGRYTKKDKIRFYRIAFGSLLESLDWNEKANARHLISNEHYQHILAELKALQKEINYLISFTNQKLKN